MNNHEDFDNKKLPIEFLLKNTWGNLFLLN